MTTGEKIYELRKKKGLTQEELADRVGVSRQAVSKWENGETYPETEKLIELCNLFGVSSDDILFGKENGDEGIPRETVSSPKNAEGNGLFVRAGIFSHYEYVSKTKVFGVPLVHINFGLGVYRAKGIFAFGNIATGFFSFGFLSAGLFSFGLLAIGLLAFGTFSVALAAFGAIGVGALVSFGGVSVGGLLSFGGVSVGNFAIGGAAIGRYAVGGYARGFIAVGNTTAIGEHAFVVPEEMNELIAYLRENVTGFLRDWIEGLARAIA